MEQNNNPLSIWEGEITKLEGELKGVHTERMCKVWGGKTGKGFLVENLV